MSFVPAPTYAEMKDGSLAIPGLPGAPVPTDPIFSARALQAAAIIALSNPLAAVSSPLARTDETVWAQLLQVAAAAALGQ